ncbi:MAG: hypothetical protein JNJ65_00070 [Cyclobacteriaceae bacterium]|nr:hypothetical protein [Cyclobacteriaceae bacterium]
MYATIVELSRLDFNKVKYFSVKIEEKEHSEFMDFQFRMRNSHPTQLGEMNALIREIGEKYGANREQFRDERKADALPPETFQYFGLDDLEPDNQFGLRLYCLRLSESVVILFNGDLKTAQKVDDCKNCRGHFKLANRITSKIDDAIVQRHIRPIYKDIIGIEDFEFEI